MSISKRPRGHLSGSCGCRSPGYACNTNSARIRGSRTVTSRGRSPRSLEFQGHVARAADAKRVFQAEFVAADVLECAGAFLDDVDEALQGGVSLALPLGWVTKF